MLMIIKGLIIFVGVVAAQGGPEYTGKIEQKPSRSEQRVNENLIKTNKKMEIEGKKRELELRRDAPQNLQADPTPKKKAPFIVHPGPQNPQDPAVYRDQYDHNMAKDPSTEFEQGVMDTRNEPSESATNAEFVRQFKENAAKAGVKVEVDPKTLKAKPVNSNGTN